MTDNHTDSSFSYYYLQVATLTSVYSTTIYEVSLKQAMAA
jgi:hypothetical protein